MSTQQIKIIDSLNGVRAAEWDALARADPFISHAFLGALETTGCTGEDAGWMPCHVLLHEGSRLTGAMPLYIKTNSYSLIKLLISFHCEIAIKHNINFYDEFHVVDLIRVDERFELVEGGRTGGKKRHPEETAKMPHVVCFHGFH